MTSALIGSIQKYSTEDGPGIRSTVFIKGCPLDCVWCHNPELISFHQQLIVNPSRCIACGVCEKECPCKCISLTGAAPDIDRESCDLCLKCTELCFARALVSVAREMSAEEAAEIVEQDKDFYAHTGGGLTVSGGELLSHVGFAGELIDCCAARGISACIDTSGYGRAADLLSLAAKDSVTTVLYDIKAFDDDLHRDITGVSNALIKENLSRLVLEEGRRKDIVARLPLIKGLNDDFAMLKRTAQCLESAGIVKATFLPYHEMGVSKARNTGGHMKAYAPPEQAELESIAEMFRSRGIDAQILGSETESGDQGDQKEAEL